MTLCPPASQDPPLYAIPLEFSSAAGTCGSVLDGKNNPKIFWKIFGQFRKKLYLCIIKKGIKKH